MLSVLRAHISPNLEISAMTASGGHAYQDVIRGGSGSLPSRQQTVTEASKECLPLPVALAGGLPYAAFSAANATVYAIPCVGFVRCRVAGFGSFSITSV